MGLGLNINNGSGGGGSFLPRVEYNAKAGRLKFSERVEVNGMWETQEQDVSFQQPAFVADMENIQVGWLMFKKGIPPVRALVPIGQPIPPCPVGDYGMDERGNAAKPKKGFVMRLLDSNRIVREFSSSASSVANALDALHDAYEAAPESKQGMLPVIQFTGATEEKSKHGVNYSPNFAIIKWVPRPAELGANGPTIAPSVAAPVAQSAAPLPPPTPQAAKPLPF
jgi:hypothetical protein